MDWLIILLIVLVVGNLGIVFLLWRKSIEPALPPPPPDMQGFVLLQNRMQQLTDTIDGKLIEVIRGVAETKESSKQVFTLAEQLSNLEKVLKNQKQRGNLGERSLELVLGNMLPPNLFKMQYEFPGGETVDAVIFTNDGIIPVDAKFPLENYTRMLDESNEERRAGYAEEFKKDLKKRIDETSKYIRPSDGTLAIAFMFIPSEAIYYDLLNDGIGAVNTRNLLDYAQNDKKVTIISPTTFAAYLTSVLYGFKAFKIEREAESIKKNVENLSKHLGAYEDYYKRLGNALSTTVNHYNSAYKELGKVDKDVLRITDEAVGLSIDAVERPMLDGIE